MYVRLFGHPKSVTIMVTNTKTILMILLMCTASLAGCIGSEDTNDVGNDQVITIAFYLADDSESNAQVQGMADRLSSDLGINVNLYDVSSEGMIIQALRFGNADIGFLEGGPAWIGWQEYGLSVLAVETTTSSGATHYNASAWVLNGSDIAEAHLDGNESTDPFALLQGKTSCHTGWLKSAGMLMPMGYLIKNGYVTPVGDTSDINSLRNTD